jgi:Ca2+-binding RTX toxin-like protein
MLRRLAPGLLIAAALLAAAYTRSDDRVLETETLSHGASDCDSDGVSVSYEVAFDEDQSPRGFRVQTVSVDGISADCEGHEIIVGLFDGPDTLARTWGTPISGPTMTLSLRRNPLVEPVDGVAVKIDEDFLPPVDATPTPTPTASDPSASPTPTPESSATDGPGSEPGPVVDASPAPKAPETPGVRPDPNGDPLPASECDPTAGLCGTTGDDSAFITDGSLASGPGSDTIAVVTGPSTTQVAVDAGPGNDSVELEINAPSGTAQTIVIDAGAGADEITLSFGQIELGATVEITIIAGAGDDVIRIPASLPPGATVRIVAGAGNDVVSASSDRQSSGGPVMFAWVSGGYRIEGNRGADVLSAGLGPDLITGGRGADVIAGRAGHDDLRGGTHGDVVRGQAGNDRLSGGRGADSLFGGRGEDRLFGGSSQDVCRGGSGDDSLRGCTRRSR